MTSTKPLPVDLSAAINSRPQPRYAKDTGTPDTGHRVRTRLSGSGTGYDPVDAANEIAETFREEALKSGKWRKKTAPEPTGECLYCTDKLPITRRWCNEECRDAWELEQRRKQLAGNNDQS